MAEGGKVFHAACYAEQRGKEVRGFAAKYNGRCSICHESIIAGQLISWRRRSKAAPAPTPGPPSTGEPAPESMGPEGPESESDDMSTGIKVGIDGRMLAEAIWPHIEGRVQKAGEGGGDSLNINVVRVDVSAPDGGEPRNVGAVHKAFPSMLLALRANVPVYIVGPSGSGKTTACAKAAEALSAAFYYTGAVGDAYSLIGYKDANGALVRTPLREAWEHGGVFLWDEVDASDPNALLAFNAMLASDVAPFPDGMIPRHKDCRLVATANTIGHGATHEYVGRNKLDGAFLARFAVIDWPYDEDLELATAPDLTWAKRVQKLRAKAKDKGLRVLITPRQSYLGGQLIAAGASHEDCERMLIAGGMTPEQWEMLS
jgi:cobaltochelatase CobS